MKYIRLLTIISIALCLLSCNKQKDKAPCANYATYQTEEYLIKYPKNWRLDTTGYMNTEFSIFSSQTSLLDKFIENVNMVKYDLADKDIDLVQFVNQSKKEIQTTAINPIEDTIRVNKSGNTFHKLIYEKEKSIFIVKYVQNYWMKDNKVYIVTFACKSNEYKKYKTKGENILGSFNLK